MNTNYSNNSNQLPGDNLSADTAISPTPARYGGILGVWYQLTAPPPPAANATIQQRQRAARGRLTSETLLLVIILVLAAEPSAFLGPDKTLVFVLLIPIFIDIIGLIFNRMGQITVAGILVITGIEVGILLSILGPALGAGGLTTYTLPQYDLLVQATLVAVTLLPPRSVFLIAFLHILITILSVLFLPHSAEFSAVLAANEYALFLRPITLQVIVAFVTYRWVTNADQAIQRADRAEEIAALERRDLERQSQELELKQQLEDGIRQVLATLNAAANGNFAIRARIEKENILFRVGYAVNTLLARLQSFRSERAELEKTRRVAEMLVTAMRDQQPVHWKGWTGTCLDPLIAQLQSPNPNGRHAPSQDGSTQYPFSSSGRRSEMG